MPPYCVFSCEGDPLSPSSDTEQPAEVTVSPLHVNSSGACVYTHMCTQLCSHNRTKNFAKALAQEEAFCHQ